ncbi:hypothetical protein PNOK_0921100 [Pyrrhoderma noxium]|uniref:Integral membrane protein n=1 Tax=Pyrrhoderma noxium TaxID=2282107 RepID=A0A286U7A8_9AGAM|nr:hypothetical protein PNOK_0921100 [Pyrrhoderma noxium]
MVDWQSLPEIQKDGLVFSKLIHCLLGIYLWEFFISLPFDFDFILRRKAFKWPLIFYFAGRYSLLFALIGIAIALNVTQEVNCQSLYIFDQVFGNSAIGFASINLSLRTIAVWSQSIYIVIPLVFIILGHWSLLLHGLLISAAWDPNSGCQITKTDNKVLAATFIYSMVFDFLVLCLTGYKLLFPRSGRSKLVKMIFGDGLIFFIVAFVANLIATIFMLLNLNPVMSIIFNVPAAIASTIVASRAVRRLTNFTSKGPEVFSSRTGQASSTLAFRGTGPYRSGTIPNKGEGVHIQMDTISTLAESGERSFIEYDASGKVKGENYIIDPESQEISDEFKRPPY